MAETTLNQPELPDSEMRWELLERVAASPHLNHAPRLREILMYVGRRSLKEGCFQVREQEIGVDVFGRSETYDTGIDNIVRTNVSELRKRIDAYFDAEGLHEMLTMEIPRGSYVPVFCLRAEAGQKAVGYSPAASLPTDAHGVTPGGPSNLAFRLWKIAAFVGFVFAIGSTAALWIQNRTTQQALHKVNLSLHPWRSQPAVAALWSEFLDSNQNTDIVISDASFTLVQNLSKQSFPFNDYLTRSYLNQLQARNLGPDGRAALSLIAAKTLVNSSESRLAQRILLADPLAKNLHYYSAREYQPSLIKNDNVILIGGPVGNPWDKLLDSPLNFTVELGGPLLAPIINRTPAANEQAAYTPVEGAVGYCVVAFLPTPNHNGKALLIAGSGSEATEAAGDFLESESQLSTLLKASHSGKFPYFEVLLRVSFVRGTPITSTIETYRTYPNLH